MKSERKQKFLELRAKGSSYDKIAQEIKVSKQTLINWSKELKLELENLRAIERDALYEQYSMSAQTRIRLFGEQMRVILGELAKRDLSDVPTYRLMEMFLKYYQIMKDEYRVLTFQSIDEDEVIMNIGIKCV